MDTVLALLPDNAPAVCTCVVGFVVLRQLIEFLSAVYRVTLRPAKNLRKAGDWAVVTGATDGIGQAMAMELASKGLSVLLLSRTEAKLDATAAALGAAHPNVGVAALAVDFSAFDEKAQARVAAALKDKSVSVLVNNVGMSYPFTKYYHELTMAEVDAMVELNVNATGRMTHLVLPGMLARRQGFVVSMSSGAAQNPSPLLSQYAGTKGYVEHFTASMHQEYRAKGVHFQVQSPLFVTTKLAKIRKASLGVPTPKAFAKAAVAAIGYEVQVSPWWFHALQLAFMAALPGALLERLVMGTHLAIRKKGLAKEAKAGKAN